MKETNDPNAKIEPGKPADLGLGKAGPAAGAPETGPLAANEAGPGPARARKEGKSLHPAQPRGRLDRETLAKIGKALTESFEDVRRQEVPERFKVLLQRFGD